MSNELSGILHRKSAVRQATDKLSILEFVVQVPSQYPQYIALQAKNDKVSQLDGVNVGDAIKVYYNLEGRLWTNPQGEEKCFNSLTAWKVEVQGKSTAPAPVSEHVPDKVDESSDLPF